MSTLYIVATPIGNLEDITIRAIKTLFSVDYIACEDTRKTGQLINNLEFKIQNSELEVKDLDINKKPKLLSYYDEIEFKRVPEIINLIEQGKSVALVSNSGTPLISDPGYKLVSECIKRGIQITSIPGPTSFVTALTSSGLPTNNFFFFGYLPPKKSQRKKILHELLSCLPAGKAGSRTSKQFQPTIIFFESPHRIKESLADLKEVFGDIEIVVARELTKIYEEILRGKISEILNGDQPLFTKGEIVILFTLKF